MNCIPFDERLLDATAGSAPAPLTAEERLHVGSCPLCREAAAGEERLLRRLGAAAASAAASAAAPGPGSAPDPGPAYWNATVPRLRRRLDASPKFGDVPGPLRVLLPAAAAVALAIVVGVFSAGPVPVVGGAEPPVRSLTEAELQVLRQTERHRALLDPSGWNGTEETTLAEFLADLIDDDPDAGLLAVADPLEVIAQAGDWEFADIVGSLEMGRNNRR